MPRGTSTRGFIFPFVLFFITAGIFLISEIFSFENTQNSYDALIQEQSQIQENLSNEAHIFHVLLQKTNSNSTSLTDTGADNDDYNKTGSGGSGIDDDEDAFSYKIGEVASGTTQNILFLNPTYDSYASLTLSSLSSINVTTSSGCILTLYKLDANNRMLRKEDFSLMSGLRTIDLTDWNNANGVTLFLKNTSENKIEYILSGSGGNIIGAKNLGNGHYDYYANLLIQGENGTFSAYSKLFSK